MIQASVVQWQNSRLPRGRPGFDSRPMQNFFYFQMNHNIITKELRYILEYELSSTLKTWKNMKDLTNGPNLGPCLMSSLFQNSSSVCHSIQKRSNGKIVYLPGKKKKTRNCSQVNGMLAGFNTFHFLSFINGVFTLVININNNINNNNNNNNLNDNNAVSNNQVSSNTNTNNANQVSISIINHLTRLVRFYVYPSNHCPSLKTRLQYKSNKIL